MMRRRTRMQDRLALLKVNINSLTEEGGVNLVPSTHAKAGFAEGQSVQGVMWAKDFIVWCFNRFRNGGDTVCSPSFCWSFGVKICKPRAKLASLLVSFAEVQPILTIGAKLCIKLLTSKHFSEKMQHFFARQFLTSRFAILEG